jgi:hypothetical protein
MAHNLHLALRAALTPSGLGQIMSHIFLLTGINYYQGLIDSFRLPFIITRIRMLLL